jgi:Cu/Ag efflux protein CusF
MKRMLMIFAGALLVCGLTFAQTEQQTPPSTTNPGMTGATTATPLQGTGRISKIDPEKRTITISDFTTAAPPSEAAPEGTMEPSATKGEEKVFKYNQQTSFASTNPESVDGRMSDLKVGDAVNVQFDDNGTIVRIEEIVASAPSEQ